MPRDTRAEIEQQVLGMMVGYGSDEARYEIAARLTPEHFTFIGNRPIFEAICGFASRGESLDGSILMNHMATHGYKDFAVQAALLQDAYTPLSRHWESVCEQLEEMHRRSQLRALGIWLSEQGEASPSEEVLAAAEARLSAVQALAKSDESTSVGDIAEECYEIAMKRSEQGGVEVIGAKTGYVLLDRCLLGVQPEKLYVVAARPMVGKSALMVSMALRLAHRGSPQAIISCEMSRRELGWRLLSIESGIPKSAIKRGALHPEAKAAVEDAKNRLRGLKLDIWAKAGARPAEVRSRCRRLKGSMGLEAVWCDYIGIMRPDAGKAYGSREQEVASMSGALKGIASDLKIAVFCLSQLNRNTEHRKSSEPVLSDLRESGAIEQDADAVIFLHREVSKEESDVPSKADLIVAKHRDGPVGSFPMMYIPTRTEYAEMAEVEDAFSR